MIKINEVSVGFPTKMANGIKVTTMPIPTDAISCSTYYELFKVIEITNEQGEVIESIEKLAEGNSSLTEEQFTTWGQEMSYVEDVVLANLGLTRI